MILVVRLLADEGTRYAPDAFAANIGQMVPVRLASGVEIGGRIVRAEVVDQGRAADVHVDIGAATLRL